MVEKDFWVCWCLQRIFAVPELRRACLFKGGTSLSKVYQVIQRFSEDIDLLLDLRELGVQWLPVGQVVSRNAANVFKHELSKKSSKYVQREILPRISSALAEYCSVQVADDKSEILYVRYPSICGTGDYVRPEIKLEFGALALGSPFAEHLVVPYMHDVVREIDCSAQRIPTVAIERTFWEKIAILHYLGSDGAYRMPPERHSRHLYDIFMIGHSQFKSSAFQMKSLLKEIVAFDQRYYPRHGVDYEDLTTGKIRLVATSQNLQCLEEDYRSMQSMFFACPPSWSELLDYLSTLQEEINHL